MAGPGEHGGGDTARGSSGGPQSPEAIARGLLSLPWEQQLAFVRSVAAEILAGLEPAERKAFLSELMENVRRLDGPDEESTLPPDA